MRYAGFYRMISTVKQWIIKLKVIQQERGVALVESLVAVAILGATVVTFVAALSTGSIAVRECDQEVTVQSLARTQLEYTKGYPYDPDATTYPTVNATDNYSISVGVSSVPDTDANIQKVTANISRDGQLILTVADYKVDR